MNKRRLNLVVGLAAKACLVSLLGCGASGTSFSLKPRLPAALKSQGWEAIREGASHWELNITPRASGKGAAEPSQTWSFGAAVAEIPVVDLPPAQSGKWELTLKLWMKPHKGRTSVAWLHGHKAIDRHSMVANAVVEIPLSVSTP